MSVQSLEQDSLSGKEVLLSVLTLKTKFVCDTVSIRTQPLDNVIMEQFLPVVLECQLITTYLY